MDVLGVAAVVGKAQPNLFGLCAFCVNLLRHLVRPLVRVMDDLENGKKNGDQVLLWILNWCGWQLLSAIWYFVQRVHLYKWTEGLCWTSVRRVAYTGVGL